jgi:hypothetical protein
MTAALTPALGGEKRSVASVDEWGNAAIQRM